MIRPAHFEDIPRCLTLLERGHKNSRYATLGNIDVARARTLLASMVARMLALADEKTFFFVTVKSGKVEGFLVAVQQPIYMIGDKLQATDIYTIVDSARADPLDFMRLVTQLKQWTFRQENVIEVQAGLTDIMGDWRRLVPIYERLGFEQSGIIMTYRQAA